MNIDNIDKSIDLTGQVAIVTGGGRGIGRAMALALAQAGAAVAVVARTADQLDETVTLIEGAGGRSLAYSADVTDQTAIEDIVSKVEKQLGPVDLLVNNAGIPAPIGPTWEKDPDAWWHCVEVNLRGPFLCSWAVLPGMVARRRGRIVTTASGAGLGPSPYASAYAAAKCAAIRLSESLAAETAGYGICTFSIHPGIVRTAMMEPLSGSLEDETWFGGFFRKVLADGRDDPPEWAANLVVFLASGRADALSGCFISVWDNIADMMRRAEEIQQKDLHTLRLRT